MVYDQEDVKDPDIVHRHRRGQDRPDHYVRRDQPAAAAARPPATGRSQRYFNRYRHNPLAQRKECRDIQYKPFHTNITNVERKGLRDMGVDTGLLEEWTTLQPYDDSWSSDTGAAPSNALYVSRATLSRGFFDCKNEFKIRVSPSYTSMQEASLLGVQIVGLYQTIADHMTRDILKNFNGDLRVTIGFRSQETTHVVNRNSAPYHMGGSNVRDLNILEMLMDEFDDDIDEDYDIPDEDSGGYYAWSAGRIMYKGGGAWIRGGKVGGSGSERRDQTPVYIQFHLLAKPSGSGRKRTDAVGERQVLTMTLFHNDPKKFNKNVADCGTTKHREDCGPRALAYLHLHKFGQRVLMDSDEVARLRKNESNKRQREDPDNAEKKAPSNRVWAFRKDYKNGKTENSAIARDSYHLMQYVRSETESGRLTCTAFEDLCVEGALGVHARVRIFVLTDNVPNVLYTTADNLEKVVDRPRLAHRVPIIDSRAADDILDHELFEESARRDHEEKYNDYDPRKAIREGTIEPFAAAPETRQTEWYHLLLHNNHYYAIVNAGAIQGQRNWCDECGVTYQNEARHMCASKCDKCYRKPCPSSGESEYVSCVDCNRVFNGLQCYAMHKKKWERGIDKNWSVCEMRYECPDRRCVGRTLNSKELDRSKHIHGMFDICWSCQAYYDPNDHNCVIRALHPSTIPKPIEVYYYDFETDQSSGEHIMNYAVVQDQTGQINRHFTTMQGFCDFVFKDVGVEDPFRPTDRRFIAHNGGRFDVQLIVRHMMTNENYDIKRIARGRNNMFVRFFHSVPKDQPEPKVRKRKGGASLKTKKTHPRRRFEPTGKAVGITITFIDSMNFISGPLRNFPKTFGLENITKGDFPHLFNREENQDYRGVVPHLMYFGPDTLPDDRLADLLQWYYVELRRTSPDFEENNLIINEIELKYFGIIGKKAIEKECSIQYVGDWVFRDEMARYCEADVTVLRQGCEKFRSGMMSVQRNSNRSSKIVKVHGITYNPGDAVPSIDPFSQVTVAGLCQKIFLSEYYRDKQLSAFRKETEAFLRKSFSGGRTEAFWLYYQVENLATQEIRKVDVTSEYPHVNKNGIYPIGQPREIKCVEDWNSNSEVQFENMEDLMKYLLEIHSLETHGLDAVGNPFFKRGVFVANLDYHPPKNLKVPVLWSKVPYNPRGNVEGRSKAGAHKLVFDLNTHEDATICSIELYEAARKGYTFSNVRRIFWWPHEQTKRGIFAKYVNVFLKMKIEAEGWPKPEMTPEEKKAYIDTIAAQNPGVDLDESLIVHNPVLRAIAKICLNTLWGKFNQRSNMVRSEIVKPDQYNMYWALMTHPDYHAKFTVLIPEILGEVRYTNTQETVEMTKNTCITVGIFTTAQGRMMWYRAADSLHPDQVLYGDTDSLMYHYDRENPEHKEIETKEGVLGAFSDEFKKKKNKVCVEFISGGPKNYGYLMVDHDNPKDESKWEIDLKIKGFNLRSGMNQSDSARNMLTYRKVIRMILANALQDNHELLESVIQSTRNYESSKDQKENEDPTVDAFLEQNLGKIPVTEHRFEKTGDFRITNQTIVKKYGYVYNKAEVDHERSTPYQIRCKPFGYIPTVA